MYVYHTDNEDVCDLIDGLLFRIPPQTPYEIPSDFIASKILEHKHMHGLVRLHTRRTNRGIEFLIDDAHQRATLALATAEQAVIDEYIRTQTEDRMQHGKPAFPPGGRQKVLVDKYKINLEQYGIRPIGVPIGLKLDPNVLALMEQNQKLITLLGQFIGGKQEGGSVVNTEALVPQPVIAPKTATPSEPPPPPPLPPSNPQAIRGPEAVSPPNPTAEDLGAKVDEESGIVIGTTQDVDNPNTVSGPIAPELSKEEKKTKVNMIVE